MTLVFSIALSLLVLSLAISKAYAGSVLTPLGVFGFVWNGLLIAFEARLVEYTPVSPGTYALLLGSYCTFLTGALTIYIGRQRSTVRHVQLQKTIRFENPPCRLAKLHRFVRLYGIMSAAGLGVWMYRLWSVGGVQPFRSAQAFRQLNLDVTVDGVVGWLLACGLAGALLAGMYLAYGGKRKVSVLMTLLPVVVFSAMTGARALTIWALLLLLCPLALIRPQVGISGLESSPRARYFLVGASLVMVLFIVGFGSLRGIVQRTGHQLESQLRFALPAEVTHVYVYATGPFAAFDYFIKSWESGPAPFEATLTPVMRGLDQLGIRRLTAEPVFKDMWATIPNRHNTYTYLADWYIDLGLLGTFIAPYLLGVVSTGLSLRPFWRHPMAFAWASFFTTYLLFSFTVSITSRTALWICMFASGLAIYSSSAHVKSRASALVSHRRRRGEQQ